MTSTKTTETSAVPAGFLPLDFSKTDNFVGFNGPLYHRMDGEHLVLGFRVEPRHCNLAATCHGGMIATLADMQLSLGARHAAGLDIMLPTVSLSIEFMRPVAVGLWVQGRTDLLHTTRNLVFAQCRIAAESDLVVRASAVLKRGPAVDAVSKLFPPVSETAFENR